MSAPAQRSPFGALPHRLDPFGQIAPSIDTRFRLRFIDPPNDGQGAGGGNENPPAQSSNGKPWAKDDAGNDLAWPAETPNKEMSADERAAYWEYQSKKHEKNRKPADFDQTQADAKAWRDAQEQKKTPEQKDLDAARDEGRRQGSAGLLRSSVINGLRAGAPNVSEDDATAIIDDLDLTKFLTADGQLDQARVNALAARHVVTTGGGGQHQDPPGHPLGQFLQHHGTPGAAGPAGSSIAEARKRTRDSLTPSTK